nr:N-lysine methyltransferase KMT5A-like [Lytechinus pictus]
MKTRRRNNSKKPDDVAKEFVLLGKDPPNFHVETFPEKGRGVVTNSKIRHGDFVLQYCGNLLSGEEGDYLEENEPSCFRYFFSHSGQEFCIDATDEPASGPIFGRLVNHGRGLSGNVKLRVLLVENRPALCMFARRTINPGEELLYDYGVQPLPWEKTKKVTSHTMF